MALPVAKQAQYWGIAAAVFVLILWVLGNVLTPFVVAGALAYCLDPVADWLERRGLRRALAVAVITVAMVLVLLLIVLLVIPPLISQVQEIVDFFSSIREQAGVLADNFELWASGTMGVQIDEQAIRDALEQVGQFLSQRSGTLLTGIANSAAGLINVFLFFVLVPATTIYLLLDWDRMVAGVDSLLPRDHAPTLRQIGRDIDQTLAGFIRGQGTVCLIVGIFYSVALSIVGLHFAIIIGATAGLITFIPYFGAFFGGFLAVSVAVFQFWGDWWMVAVVLGIFMFGQVVEGNFLTPLLMGDAVDLHPVWLLLALTVFGALFGFLGLLIAVPVTAIIGVLVRFGAKQYRSSPLYLGSSGGEPPAEDEAEGTSGR